MSANLIKMFPFLTPQLPWLHVNLQKEYLERKIGSMKNILNQHELLVQVSHKGRYRTYGGFGEDRSLLWEGFEKHGQSMIHLGVDFNNLPVGQRVCSISDGKVIHVMHDRATWNGWGSRVLIQTGTTVFLYGHLNPDLLPEVNTVVTKGQCIGVLGAEDQNGGWFSHLHFQVMTEDYVKSFEDWNLIDGYASALPSGVLDPYVYVNPAFPLAIRQKSYETTAQVEVDSKKPVLIRITASRCNKRIYNEEKTNSAMFKAAGDVMGTWTGCKFAYLHTTEVTFGFPVLTNAKGITSNRLGYNGRVQEISSLITSQFTARFNYHLGKNILAALYPTAENPNPPMDSLMEFVGSTMFESVMFEVGSRNEEMVNNVLWRQLLGIERVHDDSPEWIKYGKLMLPMRNETKQWDFASLNAVIFNQ